MLYYTTHYMDIACQITLFYMYRLLCYMNGLHGFYILIYMHDYIFHYIQVYIVLHDRLHVFYRTFLRKVRPITPGRWQDPPPPHGPATPVPSPHPSPPTPTSRAPAPTLLRARSGRPPRGIQ
jgi:hypothetical protein